MDESVLSRSKSDSECYHRKKRKWQQGLVNAAWVRCSSGVVWIYSTARGPPDCDL
jgi:hypothetical protein